MSTKAEDNKIIIDLRNQLNNNDEFIRKVVGAIALNDLDKDNPPLATILDFAIEYTDDSAPENRRQILMKAIIAIVEAL